MSDAPASDCLDDERILLLLEGRLTPAARADAESHLDECAACRLLVGAAAVTEGAISCAARLPARTWGTFWRLFSM
ncbi:MAG: zf-HC2 domain-containing protein [Polyangiaceae bacterium]